MSLFKFRRWWGVGASNDEKRKEEYDRNSMVVGNLMNSKKPENQIITASLTNGIVRIYSPQSHENLASDILLEKDFNQPILHIELGRFIPNNNKSIALAILFPRKLTVFCLFVHKSNSSLFEDKPNNSASSAPIDENPTKIVHYQLKEIYSNPLPRLSFNFCIGGFGGEFGKDLFCIQSFDGQLSFFNQNRYEFARFLPNFVVPGPIKYFKQIDCLITYNSSLKIQCFRYDALLSSLGSQEKEEENSRGKKVQMEWEVTVGEEVYDIQIVRYVQQSHSGQYEIFVLGERTLFTISKNGSLTSQKRLDFFPSCVCPYIPAQKSIGRTERQKRHRIIVGTHSKSLMIFNHPKLIWSAKTESIPIGVRVGTFGGKPGMLVMITDEGDLTVGYLGTDPGTSEILSKKNSKPKENLNYRLMDKNLQKLRSKIRKSVKKGIVDDDPSKRIRKIEIMYQISYDDDDDDNEEENEGESEDDNEMNTINDGISISKPKRYPRPKGRAVLKVTVRNSGQMEVDNVHLQVTVPNGYSVRPKPVFEIIDLKHRGTPFHATLSIVVKPCTDVDEEDIDEEDMILPVVRSCTISAMFSQTNGEPNIVQKMFILPFSMTGSLILPPRRMTGSSYSLKVKASRKISLREILFSDLFGRHRISSSSSSNDGDEIITFRFHGSCYKDSIVSIISNSKGEYKILTDHFPSLFPIVAELVRKLVMSESSSSSISEESKKKEKNIEVRIESIPLYEYFEVIDVHFNVRLNLRKKLKKLEEVGTQFRNIQKRLIVRYQDRNPKPLGGMEKLLEMTYKEMFELTIEIQNLQMELRKSNIFVTSGTKLVLLCIQFMYKHLNEKDLYILRNCWGSNLESDCSPTSIEDQGWEERTYGSLSYLFYTIFEKKGKELRKKLLENPTIKRMKDTKSLKTIVSKIIEKLKTENIFVVKGVKKN